MRVADTFGIRDVPPTQLGATPRFNGGGSEGNIWSDASVDAIGGPCVINQSLAPGGGVYRLSAPRHTLCHVTIWQRTLRGQAGQVGRGAGGAGGYATVGVVVTSSDRGSSSGGGGRQELVAAATPSGHRVVIYFAVTLCHAADVMLLLVYCVQ